MDQLNFVCDIFNNETKLSLDIALKFACNKLKNNVSDPVETIEFNYNIIWSSVVIFVVGVLVGLGSFASGFIVRRESNTILHEIRALKAYENKVKQEQWSEPQLQNERDRRKKEEQKRAKRSASPKTVKAGYGTANCACICQNTSSPSQSNESGEGILLQDLKQARTR